LDNNLKAQETKATLDKRDDIKPKTFLTTKEHSTQCKVNLQEMGENVFKLYI
jgi:hypothetical protein